MHRAESIGREEPEPPEHLLSMLSMPEQYKIAGEHRDGWKCKQTTKQNCKKLSGNRKNGGKSMIKNLCQKKPKVYCKKPTQKFDNDFQAPARFVEKFSILI